MPTETNDPTIKKVALAAFPDYTGRKFHIEILGDKDYVNMQMYSDSMFSFVRLADLKATKQVYLTEQERYGYKGAESVKPPKGVALVQKMYFTGKCMGLFVYVNSSDVNKTAIEEKQTLSFKEEVILGAVKMCRSTFEKESGIMKRTAMEYGKMDGGEYETLLAVLKDNGYLTPKDRLTMKGKNYIDSKGNYEWGYRWPPAKANRGRRVRRH